MIHGITLNAYGMCGHHKERECRLVEVSRISTVLWAERVFAATWSQLAQFSEKYRPVMLFHFENKKSGKGGRVIERGGKKNINKNKYINKRGGNKY